MKRRVELRIQGEAEQFLWPQQIPAGVKFKTAGQFHSSLPEGALAFAWLADTPSTPRVRHGDWIVVFPSGKRVYPPTEFKKLFPDAVP